VCAQPIIDSLSAADARSLKLGFRVVDSIVADPACAAIQRESLDGPPGNTQSCRCE
jgi:hypothetical protein